MSVQVTFHGHATFSLDVNGTKLLVDPFFGGNPAATIDADEVNPDYILVTHGHGDHIADALPIAQRSGAMIIANAEISGWFNKQGYEKTHPQHIGGGFNYDFGRVKMTIAFHGSGLPDGSYGGNPAGFLLTVDDKKIYIAGDTAVYSDMSLIGRDGLDLAILPIGDNFTMGPDDALLALDFLKPKAVIPCHYNTWPLIEVDVDEWVGRVKEKFADMDVIVLESEGTHSL
ncbi:MAG TPA: metal-dependent hydrolase [Anaerolineae bacterium]|nr:metal-dependent hydrolase [Anaerolineae bacterium]